MKVAARLIPLVVLVALANPARSQEAEQQPQTSPFSVRLAIDLPIVAISGGIGAVAEFVKGELPGPACVPSCDPSQINALDRTVIGNRSPAARTASDVFLGLNLGLPFALDFIDVLVNHPADRFLGFGQDALVLAEVFTVSFGINEITKFAVRRPRPFAYDSSLPLDERMSTDAALSFYSGHSSASFAMATAYSYLFMKRHPGSKLIAPVWVIAESMAAVTAYLRVHAGMHFYTDVLTGALVGASVGLLVPYLHRKIVPNQALPKLAGWRMSIVPTLFSDGAGVLVAFREEADRR